VNGHPDLGLSKKAGTIFGSTDSLSNSSADANPNEAGKVQYYSLLPDLVSNISADANPTEAEKVLFTVARSFQTTAQLMLTQAETGKVLFSVARYFQ
jgi:hypothetical protein